MRVVPVFSRSVESLRQEIVVRSLIGLDWAGRSVPIPNPIREGTGSKS